VEGFHGRYSFSQIFPNFNELMKTLSEDIPQEASKTYVNLVQLMMPHPKPVSNMPQQV